MFFFKKKEVKSVVVGVTRRLVLGGKDYMGLRR